MSEDLNQLFVDLGAESYGSDVKLYLAVLKVDFNKEG